MTSPVSIGSYFIFRREHGFQAEHRTQWPIEFVERGVIAGPMSRDEALDYCRMHNSDLTEAP